MFLVYFSLVNKSNTHRLNTLPGRFSLSAYIHFSRSEYSFVTTGFDVSICLSIISIVIYAYQSAIFIQNAFLF